MFVESVKEHGRDWSRIAHLIQDKTEQQIVNYYKRLKKQIKQNPNDPNIADQEFKERMLETEKGGPWSVNDHEQFVESVKLFGKDWKVIGKILNRKE